MLRTKPIVGFLATAMLALASGVPAQQGEARIPVRVLGGRLVARCQLSSPTSSAPVNLWLAYDKPCGLELHNKVAAGLAVEQPDGTMLPITIELPGLDIEVDMREHGDEQGMEDFTKRYAPQMEEISVAGTIGGKILSQYEVTYDLARGQVRLKPAVDREGARPDGPEKHYVPGSVAGDIAWMPAKLANGQVRMLGIGSSRYDAIVDEDFCFEVDQPGGQIGSVEVAGYDLSKIVAWRPESYDHVHRDGALATLGLGFLQTFRVHIDTKNGWIGLTRVRELPFPAEEAAFFVARAEEEVAPLAGWIKQHGESRLAGEAASMLLQMQVDEGADAKDVEPALRWMHETRPADMKATEALATVDMLVQSRRPDLAVMAGRFGIDGGRKDRYPEATHRLHVRLGELLLEMKDERGAWEHLMSAAFGLTDAFGSADRAKVNLLLGRVYELQGKHRRAMSRYVQAVISPEFGPQAVPLMEGLQSKMGGEPFSYELVDRLISGKVRSMTAPTRFVASGKNDNNRCVLVEHITNPHLGQKQGERWRAFTEGGAMVFEALQSHFPVDRVTMLSYHVDAPQPVALMNEVSMAMADSVGKKPVFLVNGREAGPGACRYPDADSVYQDVRDVTLQGLRRKSPFTMTISARLEEGVVRGTLQVKGPTRSGRNVELILAEKGAIYPGLGATVVHRMVARAALTERVRGIKWQPTNGVMEIPFARALNDIEAANITFLDDYEKQGGSPASRLSTRLAKDQLVVVAVLREPGTRIVEQSVQCDVLLAGQEDER
ncbi:MAG: hypothetical protein ACI91B_000063 [Planctomycetota bacterium]|jgi:hypothetical protein